MLLLVAEGRGLTDTMGRTREVDLVLPASTPFTWIVMWDRFSEDVWTVFPTYGIICDGDRQLRRSERLPAPL